MLNLGLGFGEILLVVALLLVVVGPDKLPELVRYLGKQYGKLVRASDELRRAFVLEADRADAEQRATQLKKRREEARARASEARDQARAAREEAAALGEDVGPEPVEPVARVEASEPSVGGSKPPPAVSETPADSPPRAESSNSDDEAARALDELRARVPEAFPDAGTDEGT